LKFYPVGTIFNGQFFPEQGLYSYYTLRSKYFSEQGASRRRPRGYPGTNPLLKYIVGLDGYALTHRGPNGYFQINPGDDLFLNFDNDLGDDQDGLFGYGIYQLEILYLKETETGNELEAAGTTIKIYWTDFKYPYSEPGQRDLVIYVRSATNVKYEWFDGYEIGLFDENLEEADIGNIKVYRQYKEFHPDPPPGWWDGYFTTPSGHSLSKSDDLNYPMTGLDLPAPDYRIPRHDNPNILSAVLKIPGPDNAHIQSNKNFTIDGGSVLFLERTSNGGSKCIVEPNASLIVKQYGSLGIQLGCTLEVQSRGKFCNYGGTVANYGSIIIHPGPHPMCLNQMEDFLIRDSTQVILLDSAEWEIPDSSTITLEGNVTSLIMNPHSKIKFGTNSKLIIKDSARLYANNASFTSLDGSSTWDGIYLDGSTNDTLKYCTFSNTTQTQLTSGVYVNNPYSAF
jgi:hypothetical protein